MSLPKSRSRGQRLYWCIRLLLLGVALVAATAGAVSASSTSGQAGGVLRLLPPPDGQAYFGFTVRTWDSSDPAWGDTRPFAERMRDSIETELAQKRPTFLRVWADWQASDQPGQPMVPFSTWSGDIALVRSVTGPRSLVFLDWTLTNPGAERPGYTGITTKDIAAGKADDYIRAYARGIRADGGPFLIRLFGGEFNGSWWYSQSPYANHSLTPADFANAWRRVVDIFRQEGAANASFAWVPNAIPAANRPGWIDPNLSAYYPGDEYVDWAGADVYDFEPVSDLIGVYDFAVAHQKPFFLAEWAVRHDASSLTPSEQRSWIDAMFDFFDSHNAVKAISYFNYDNRAGTGKPIDPARVVYLYGGRVNYQANVNDDDHRLLADSGAGFRGTFSTRIASSRYVSAVRTETVGGETETASATLVSVTVRGLRATVRWRGNGSASTFDLGLRRAHGQWRTLVTRYPHQSYTVRGTQGTRYAVRVRGRNASGVPGPWSAARSFKFR
jgi:Glycosyl hydrolase family 26